MSETALGNNTMARKQIIKALFLLLLVTSFNASSSTIVFDATGSNVGADVKVKYDGDRDYYEGFGGLMGFDQTGGTFTGSLLPDSADVSKFTAFCIDVTNGYAPGEVHNVSPLSLGTNMGQAKADDISRLLNNVYPDFSQSISSKNALALQIAIWEIVHEDSGTYDVFDGKIEFRWDDYSERTCTNHRCTVTDEGARGLAQDWLDQYVINQTGDKLDNLLALTRGGAQDLLAQTVSAVPVPGAVWLFGSAFAGLIGFGKRRKNQS